MYKLVNVFIITLGPIITIMKHFKNNAKEYLKKMTEEDKKYRQGRSRRRVEQTEIVAGWSIIICLLIILVLAIFNAYVS